MWGAVDYAHMPAAGALTLGGEGILSVRLEKVMAMLFLGSSAAYEKVNRAYGVMTAIWRRYLHHHTVCTGAQPRPRFTACSPSLGDTWHVYLRTAP